MYRMAPAFLVFLLACQVQPTKHPSSPSQDIFVRFDNWLLRYSAAHSAQSATSTLRNEGLGLAAKRRNAFRQLMQQAPEIALHKAIPDKTREQLPRRFLPFIEKRIQTVAQYEVYACRESVPTNEPCVERFVVLGQFRYRAIAFGKTLGLPSMDDLPLSGLILDDLFVIDPDVVPATPGEIQALSNFDDPNWAVGAKRVLVLRVDFPDIPGIPHDPFHSLDLTEELAQQRIADMNTYFQRVSYGQLSVTGDVTPVFRMPEPVTYYYGYSGGYNGVRIEAISQARAAGYDVDSYDFDITGMGRTRWPWQGIASVRSRGLWLNGYFHPFVWFHEFGHNLGVYHGNSWEALDDSIIGPGSSDEYGDIFEIMGHPTLDTYDADFNIWFKTTIGWLGDLDSETIVSSGSYRVQAMDSNPAGTYPLSLQIPRDERRDYWVEFRDRPDNPWLDRGASVRWGYASNLDSNLLDMTPGSAFGLEDSALHIGRTFSDPNSGIHLTPVAIQSGAPRTMDLQVNLGFFPDNQPPTLSLTASSYSPAVGASIDLQATATDPDGDTLAYFWELGDGSLSANQAALSHSWSTAGEYVVRCVVSDMRGGRSSTHAVVTVGAATTYRIQGSVLTNTGTPVEGVRVHVSATQMAHTSSDGSYTIAGLDAGDYEVNAIIYGYSLALSGASNPITVGPNASGVDFVAIPGAVSIRGQVQDSQAMVGRIPIAGVVVSDGTRSATTDSMGNYTIAGVPDGFYTMTASKLGYEIVPNTIFFSNPVEVAGTELSAIHFERKLYFLEGTTLDLYEPATIETGDGIHGGGSFEGMPGDGWVYFAQIPQGQWNVYGRAPGYMLVPSNFTNPVSVVDSNLAGIDLQAVAGDFYVVTGSITYLEEPLIGAVATDGTRTSSVDSLGHYTLIAVPDGSYTVTPTMPGYVFSPPTQEVTVSAADINSVDFVATVADNSSPTISHIPDQTTPLNISTEPISFTVGDSETDVDLLILSAGSSGTLVKPSAVVFAGSGANRTVTITPTEDMSGIVTVTITVSDGELTSSEEFQLSVVAPFDAGPPQDGSPVDGNLPDTARPDSATPPDAGVDADLPDGFVPDVSPDAAADASGLDVATATSDAASLDATTTDAAATSDGSVADATASDATVTDATVFDATVFDVTAPDATTADGALLLDASVSDHGASVDTNLDLDSAVFIDAHPSDTLIQDALSTDRPTAADVKSENKTRTQTLSEGCSCGGANPPVPIWAVVLIVIWLRRFRGATAIRRY